MKKNYESYNYFNSDGSDHCFLTTKLKRSLRMSGSAEQKIYYDRTSRNPDLKK